MSKPTKPGDFLPLPKSHGAGTNKKLATKKHAKSPMMTKASYAFHAAKGRCNNINNKDYPKYGGAGIQFLIPDIQAMLSEIGLPKPGQSLDRKDPHGHYEIGNIRWTNAHVQAANKKGLNGGWGQSDDAIALQVATQVKLKEDRKAAASNWIYMVRALNRGYVTDDDVECFTTNALPLKALEAGWDLGQPRDLAEPPSYFHLPSLTVPGEVVRLNGGAFEPAPAPQYIRDDRIRGYNWLPVPVVISPAVLKQLPNDLFGGTSNGVLFVGASHSQFLALGGLEGLFLVLASRMAYGPPNKTASMLPMLAVLRQLSQCGPSYKWGHAFNESAVLDALHLFIPDVQIGSGGKSQLTTPEWGQFTKLIEYRVAAGKRTYVGVHNLAGLPPFVAEALIPALKKVDMPQVLYAGNLCEFVSKVPFDPNHRGLVWLAKTLKKNNEPI